MNSFVRNDLFLDGRSLSSPESVLTAHRMLAVLDEMDPESVLKEASVLADRFLIEGSFGLEIEFVAPAHISFSHMAAVVAEIGQRLKLPVCAPEYSTDEESAMAAREWRRYDAWQLTEDETVSFRGGRLFSDVVEENGFEIVSPVLAGRKGAADYLALMMVLHRMGCEFDETCGSHVHLGASRMNTSSLRNLAVLFAENEQVVQDRLPEARSLSTWSGADRMIYGRDVEGRGKAREALLGSLSRPEAIRDIPNTSGLVVRDGNRRHCHFNRKSKLSFLSWFSRKETIEYRALGSSNPFEVLAHARAIKYLMDESVRLQASGIELWTNAGRAQEYGKEVATVFEGLLDEWQKVRCWPEQELALLSDARQKSFEAALMKAADQVMAQGKKVGGFDFSREYQESGLGDVLPMARLKEASEQTILTAIDEAYTKVARAPVEERRGRGSALRWFESWMDEPSFGVQLRLWAHCMHREELCASLSRCGLPSSEGLARASSIAYAKEFEPIERICKEIETEARAHEGSAAMQLLARRVAPFISGVQAFRGEAGHCVEYEDGVRAITQLLAECALRLQHDARDAEAAEILHGRFGPVLETVIGIANDLSPELIREVIPEVQAKPVF